MALILDTGPLVAALDAGDPHHGPCAALLRDAGEDLVIPAPVLPEVDYWLDRAPGTSVMQALIGEVLQGVYRVADLVPGDYARVGELMGTYADASVGFVDAAVLAVVERLAEPKLATLDKRDFTLMRPQHVEALALLPA